MMIRRVCILGACLALLPAVSQAALVMLVEGVPGPSKVQNYSGWFILDSVEWGIGRSNVAAPHTLTVSLVFSANVATLAQASASGAVFRKIAVDQISAAVENAPQLVSRLVCEEASIREFSSSADSNDRAQVELDIRCARLTWEGFDYDSQNKALAKGAKGSWNFKTNTP
jgi:hypothetical protein